MCIRCLKKGHNTRNCDQKCSECGGRHHTLLHFEEKRSDTRTTRNFNGSNSSGSSKCAKGVKSVKSATSTDVVSEKENGGAEASGSSKSDSSIKANASGGSSFVLAVSSKMDNGHVFLGTVILEVQNQQGETIRCRALLDSGSQLNCITEKLRRKLGISYKSVNCNLIGIGDRKAGADKRASLVISSIHNGYSTNIEALISQKISANIPSQNISINNWPIPRNIHLADPNFNRPANIDMLIGAELYSELMSIGQIRMGENLPTLQNTLFGWIVMGKSAVTSDESAFCGVTLIGDDFSVLNRTLEKFWKMEEVEEPAENLTNHESEVEKHFVDTVKRNKIGRFVVRLPFTGNPFYYRRH